MDSPSSPQAPSYAYPPPSYEESTAYDSLDSNRLPPYKMSYLFRAHPYLRYSGHPRYYCVRGPPTYDEPTTPRNTQQIQPTLTFLNMASIVPAPHEAVSPTDTEVSDASTAETDEESVDDGQECGEAAAGPAQVVEPAIASTEVAD